MNVEQRHPAEAAQPQPGRPGGRRWGGQGAAGAFRSRPRRSYNLSGLLGTQRYFLGFWEVRRPRSVSLAMVKESAGQSFWRLQERLRSLVFLSFWRCPHSLAGGPFLLTPPPPRLCFVVTPHDSDCPWPRATLPPPTELCFPLHGLLGHISLCLPLVRTCDPTGPIPIIQGNRPSQDSQNHLPSPRQGNVCTASGFKGIFWGWYQLPLPSSPTSLPWPLHSALTNCSWVPLSHLSLAFANGTISTWPGTFQQGLLSRGLPCFGLTMAGTEDHNILPSVTFPGHCAPPQGLEDPVALLRPWPSDRASLSERCGMDGEWKRPYLSGR